jgi:hypothetical protein
MPDSAETRAQALLSLTSARVLRRRSRCDRWPRVQILGSDRFRACSSNRRACLFIARRNGNRHCDSYAIELRDFRHERGNKTINQESIMIANWADTLTLF